MQEKMAEKMLFEKKKQEELEKLQRLKEERERERAE